MQLFENVILTDFDGVLGYWEHGFMQWMLEKGYDKPIGGCYDIESKYGITTEEAENCIIMFGLSEWFTKLPPMRDAIKYVKKLHEEHGYVFHCISSIPNTDTHKAARWKNIRSLFGETAFEKLVLCVRSHEKDEHLKAYSGSGCYWVEDLGKNAVYGLNHGLKPILITQHYNVDFENKNIPRVTYWKEIYDYVTGLKDYPL